MPRPLPGFLDRELMIEEQRQALNRILAEVDAEHEEPMTVAGATAPLDHRRRRGIPAVGRGVGGAVFSTDPVTRCSRRNDEAGGLQPSSRNRVMADRGMAAGA